jgi:hypothetical protein
MLENMYNKDLVCSYKEKESNELFQKELLEAFYVSTYEELSNHIEQLYHLIRRNSQLQELLQKVEKKYEWANKDHCFYLLFSYDYFIYTHDYIKDILNDQNPKNHVFLCSSLE